MQPEEPQGEAGSNSWCAHALFLVVQVEEIIVLLFNFPVSMLEDIPTPNFVLGSLSFSRFGLIFVISR